MTIITGHRAVLLTAALLALACLSSTLVLGQSQFGVALTNNAAEAAPLPLPVSPGGARIALSVTNGVHAPSPPKVRSTGKYATFCPQCNTAQTNAPTSLRCIGQMNETTNTVRFQYEGTFPKCKSCGLEYMRSWYGPVVNDTPVIEIMEEVK